MRPLRLTMTAFGPYKGEETIDFEQLDGANLFVISGNTGAGKTTIFDGICFALYGSASGEDRAINTMLRSHFADDDVHTSVEFVFTLHNRIYRILRQLGHMKKGNKTRTGESYEFVEVKEGKEIPIVDRQIVSEINTKVEQMIGLTQEQFKQIVMLPQGEFRKLLTSNTENKEQILRKIFRTERFNALNDKLRQKRDEIQRTYEQEVNERAHYIQQIASIFPEREESSLLAHIQAEEVNMYHIEQSLGEEIEFYQQKRNVDEKEYKTAYERHEKKQQIYVEAKAVNALFTELASKNKRAEQINEQASFMKEQEQILERADRASRIIVYEQQARSFREDEGKREAALKQIETTFATATKQLAVREQQFEQEEKRAPEREAINKTLDQYMHYLPTVQNIANQEKERELVKNQADQLGKHVQTSQKQVEQTQKNMEELRKVINEKDKQTGTLFEKERLRNTMREQASYFQQYNKERKQFVDVTKQLAGYQKEVEAAKSTYDQLESRWVHSQASVLASHLQAGQPCPVCGSNEHPAIAVADEQDVTREQLATAKKELDGKNTTYHTAVGTKDGIKRRLDEIWQTIYSHFPITIDELEETYSQLVKKGKQVSEEVTALTTIKKELDEQKETYEKIVIAERTYIEERDKAQKNYEQAADRLKELQTIQAEQVRTIPEEIRQLEALQNSIKRTEEKKKQADDAWETAQKELQQAKDQVTKITAEKASHEQQLTEAIKRREQAVKAYQTALQKSGFSSEEAYHRAQLSEQEQKELKQTIDEYHQERIVLAERIASIEKELAGKEAISIDDLEKELHVLKQTYEQAWQVMQTSKQYIERGELVKNNLLDAHKQVAALDKKRSVIADIYDVIRGQNGPKISFERYIQMDYLEQIIEAANERFRILSNGQYTLLRSDRQETHGRQSGLALDVHDAYTGQKRDVKTLSGGEKFNASLSLALGMSDVVQSFQGNVSVETMFIDEGFGTLDEEALQSAINTLIDLQRSGRMIGVISHVQQLKELFPAVLEVEKTKEGHSETTFNVK